ncbi:hypothetical protein [Aporhodopirellula aestuarii]|uniref:Uncharacterized protein n=1 Tax=Aporhodopirellula aestuarii TaxID=2950107 RepID=A0ABT0U8I6_9BACT|nr:hypothetical protein [Aporhodopirellula aestuarii]MCM2372999.1 hypothetical protein [Aporhodopirellula aestuarii]
MPLEQEQPRYFPTVDELAMPVLSEACIEQVALVLAAISPTMLDQPSSGCRTLYEVNHDPKVVRVDPAVELRQDHRYLLRTLHDGSDESFDKLWFKSKRLKGSGDSSLLLDLVKRLRDLEIDEDGDSLARSKHQKIAAEIFPNAARVQYYFFHSAVQKIDRELSIRRVSSQSRPVVGGFLRRFFETPEEASGIEIPELILVEAELYLASSINLCRVLRSVAQRIRRADAS